MPRARAGEYDKAEGFALGADASLPKPFSFVVLIARLRALLRRGAPARPAVLEAGDLRLDPSARTVHRGQQRIELTARGVGVLEFLLRRPGPPPAKNEVLGHRWDAHYDRREDV